MIKTKKYWAIASGLYHHDNYWVPKSIDLLSQLLGEDEIFFTGNLFSTCGRDCIICVHKKHMQYLKIMGFTDKYLMVPKASFQKRPRKISKRLLTRILNEK